MLLVTTEQKMQAAVVHHRAGRLAEAEALYRAVLTRDENHPDALNLLGVIATQVGCFDQAIHLIGRAIRLRGDDAGYHANLGMAYGLFRRFDEAVAAYSIAIQIKPDQSEAHCGLGNALTELGRIDEAIGACTSAVELDPRSAEAHNNLGNALSQQGKYVQAAVAFRKAIQIKPTLGQASYNLGNVLRRKGKCAEAAAAYSRAIHLSPGDAMAHNNLAIVLQDQGNLDGAVASFRQAIQLKPGFAAFHGNLGVALKLQGKLDEAIDSLTKATQLNPTNASNHCSLGSALKDQGRLDDALACFDRAIALKPNDPTFLSLRLYAIHFHPAFDSNRLLQEHKVWDQRFGQSLRQHFRSHVNVPIPDRRLRIGYVSPNFREHVVGYNLLPLFREHDRGTVEVFGYSDAQREDRRTEQFRSYADRWQNVFGIGDQQLAERIRHDRIDILVDLSLHMAGSRLPTFAEKPAPVQVTFAGYPGGTGLMAIDYRLTDPYLDPPSLGDSAYVEQSIRLPHTFWCYDPETMASGMDVEPPVTELPATTSDHLTFGCVNNFCKLNDQVLALWAQVLTAVPGSRILLLAAEGHHRQRVADRLGRDGIDAGRIEFVLPAPRAQYLAYYDRIDIGLDTFPYNGHTTSLDSLWMGVPVITLVGATVVGRAGLSQLSNLGLTDLVATTPPEYVRIAAELARDLPRLSELRAGLRPRMRQSALTDAPRFARDIEAAYQKMWRRWCAIAISRQAI